MDNHQRSVGGFLQRFVRGFTHQHPIPNEPSIPEDDPDLADIPPLQSIPSLQRSEDREMTPVENLTQSDQGHATPLQSSSASQTSLESYDQPSRTDVDIPASESPAIPEREPRPYASTPLRSSRRSRVDDEVEEGDVRETNRQRVHSPPAANAQGQQEASQPSQQPRDAPNDTHRDSPPNAPPPYPRLVYTVDFYPPPPGHFHPPQPGQPQRDGQAQPQDHNHHHHHHHHLPPPPMYNFTFQVPVTAFFGGAPGTEDAHGVPLMMDPEFAPPFFGLPAGHPGFVPFFQFGQPREEEQDDPERAKRLIRGLEPVPEGLVQRIERVGDGEGGEAVCSICWEKLSAEGGGFDADAQSQGRNAENDNASAGETVMDVDNSSASAPAAAPANPPEGEGQAQPENDLPKIVALPCSHVFHTACLLPWFTKPHRTTCPSCRFDIDPDSLTYVPPRRRRARHARQTQGPAPAPAHAQPQPHTDAQPTLPHYAAQPAPDAVPAQGQNRQPRGPPMMPFEFYPMMGHMPANMPAGGVPLPRGGRMPIHNFWEQMFAGAYGPIPLPQQQAQPAQTAPAPNASRRPFSPPPQQPQAAPNAADPTRNVPPHSQSADPAGAGVRAQGRPRPPEKRQWTLPPPPGPTLRHRIERQEREMGLRCSDISCGLGPSDDDPLPVVDPSVMRQIAICRLDGSGARECEHTFHPSCLVSAERVAGWGAEDSKEEKEGDEVVQVSCPVCRAVGVVSRTDWDEGACALA